MRDRVDIALRAADDADGASLWRDAWRLLGGGMRVALAGCDEPVLARCAAAVSAACPGVVVLTVAVARPEPGEAQPLAPSHELLGVHHAAWVTSLPSPFGAAERAAFASLVGLPPQTPVVIDLALLERVADDPAAEAVEVRNRVETLAPEGADVLDVDGLIRGWARADAHLAPTRDARRAEVARTLVDASRARLAGEQARQHDAVARLDGLLAAEEDALAAARRHGERAAAYLLSAVRRRTEELLLALRAFLHDLERDVPEQVAEVDEVDEARRALPHWLQHVVEGWVRDQLGTWRAAVADDVRRLGVEAGDTETIELLLPALYVAPLRDDPSWARRLVASAAVGGGAALLALGLWIPGALVLGGGLAWGALGRASREAVSREQLVQSAQAAVRELAREADAVLTAQLATLEQELAELGDRRSDTVAAAQAAIRERLVAQRAWHGARADALEHQIAELDACLVELP